MIVKVYKFIPGKLSFGYVDISDMVLERKIKLKRIYGLEHLIALTLLLATRFQSHDQV